MENMSLGDRMKKYYEDPYRIVLPRRMPVIIRIDGRAFHTLTKPLNKPFDAGFSAAMDSVAYSLYSEIQNCYLVYRQSDELNVLMLNDKDTKTESWFDNNLQKIVSIASSMSTFYFNKFLDNDEALKQRIGSNPKPQFDARAFVIPREEVCNYFIWRQQDAIRNAIQAVGRAEFGHKEMHGKSTSEVVGMLENKYGLAYEDMYYCWDRMGTIFVKPGTISCHLEFKNNRHLIENLFLDESADVPF